MQGGTVTTPFGRRSMSLALVRRQVEANEIPNGKSAEKWRVFRDASEARELLGLQDRSLAVLDALLSFYPESELRQDAPMIVFPANTQLSVRAHGIAGATLRRHLALLVEAGLIVRRDSANGKRYARKDGSGNIEKAFGFDLSPLLMRAEELAGLAQQVAAERLAMRRAKEDLTILRRDVRKLISAAIEEGAAGDWEKIEAIYIDLVGRLPRTPKLADIVGMLGEMRLLHDEAVNTLGMPEENENNSTNAAHSERHIQSSDTESSYESEPGSREVQGPKPSEKVFRAISPQKAFPLTLVLRACPEIGAYGPGGSVASWRDLMSAAVTVRSMLGVSPSAYQEACEVMGPENTATTIACILERGGHINSAGGYLRNLTARSRRSEFSLGPMLMALLRSGGYGKEGTRHSATS